MTLIGKCTWPLKGLFYRLACWPACEIRNRPTRQFLEFTILMLLQLVLWVQVVAVMKLLTACRMLCVDSVCGANGATGVPIPDGVIESGRQLQWLVRRTRTVTCLFLVRIVLAMTWRCWILYG